MSDRVYCYPPDYTVLRNTLNVRDAETLERIERRFVVQRISEGISKGRFDLEHLRTIHRHLFQDVYEWAGDVRSVEISKGGNRFQFARYIETGMADIHRRLRARNLLRNLSGQSFCEQAGEILGDINYVHPFREGNGRTQLLYLRQLAEQAGHRIDLTRIEREAWMDASRQAHLGAYDPMSACIADALGVSYDRVRGGEAREH